MTETPTPAAPEKPERTSLSAVLAVWCGLAALAQICFLAYWPLYVLDTRLDHLPAVFVALARLGLYLGLAWGLARRLPEAWAGVSLELIRSFVLVVTPMLAALFQREPQSISFFPAVWAQGLLAGALPMAILFDIAVACGWRPGAAWLWPPAWGGRTIPLLDVFMTVVRVAVAVSLAIVSSLWREHAQFGVEASERGAVLIRRGVPFVLALSLVEGGAALLSHRHAASEGARPARRHLARRDGDPAQPLTARGVR